MAEIYILVGGMVISFLTTVIILTKRPSEVQKWYLLASVGVFAYLAANYIKRYTDSPVIYIYLQEVIYATSAVFSAGFIFGTMEALGINISKKWRNFFSGYVIAECLILATIHLHQYFYREINLFPNPAAPGLYANKTVKGWLYHWYVIFNIVLMIGLAVFFLRGLIRKKGNKIRLIRILVIALTMPVASKLLSAFPGVPTAVLNHCAYIATNISMLLLVQYFEITVTLPIIKERAIERSADGIVILDRNRIFRYANDTAERLFPALKNDDPDEVTAFIERELTVETVTRDEREYEIRCEEEVDSFDRKSGYLMIIHDVTEREKAKRKEQELFASEMNLASSIQISALPNTFPAFPDRKEFDIFALMDPAREIGGDFYDFFFIDDDHLALVIADVSGKGISASLFMMVSKALIQNQLMSGCDPAQALQRVNTQLCERNRSKMFVTVWAAVLEVSTGKGLVCNAGHENPAVRHNGGPYELLTYRHNVFLGISRKAIFTNRPFKMKPGDSLFVYTDGVTEARNAEQEMFGEARLETVLNLERDAEPEKVIDNVRNAVNSFVMDAPQFDDITMLALKYYGVADHNDF